MAVEKSKIYEDIATRTNGDIYLGIVGPVRTGKSTFIKRFMETLVLPKIDNNYVRERAKDELPQSGSGRTIMTAEPKFVPEEAVNISVGDETNLSVRLIDCVGYVVEGAIGHMEDGSERLVTTPWFDTEIPMSQAAEYGTKKVIQEHSTIGIVITTDGSITEIAREAYLSAEDRVITELKEIGKPFIVLLNSANPESVEAKGLADELSRKYDVTCMAVNCMTLSDEDITNIIENVLEEFPIYEFDFYLPKWVERLEKDNPIKASIYAEIKKNMDSIDNVKSIGSFVDSINLCDNVSEAKVKQTDLGKGITSIEISVPRELFYNTLGDISGFSVADDGDLVSLLADLSKIKSKYDKIAEALEEVENNGYGIVLPDRDELTLKEPEIIKRAGKYSVRLKASAPSIHMIKADIETEVSPAVGGEKSSGDMISFLLQEFEGDTSKIWESNIFGKSLHDIAGDNLQAKIRKMPAETQIKLRETLQRIINEGAGGLICIIL